MTDRSPAHRGMAEEALTHGGGFAWFGSLPAAPGRAALTNGHGWLRRLRLPLGMLLSLLCLTLVFRHVSLARVLAAFAAVSPGWVVIAVLAVAPAFIATAARWRLLLAPSGAVSPWRAGRLLAIAYLLNLVLPARPGDMVRAYLVGRPKGPSLGAALTTIVVEKALDGAAVVLLMLVLLGELPAPGWLGHGAVVAAVSFGALLSATTFLANGGERVAGLPDRLFRRHNRARRLVAAVFDQARLGAGAFADRRSSALILGLTVIVWCSTLVTTYSLAQAFGLAVPSALPALALAAATLGLVVPAAPGGVGPYQVLVMAVLVPAGVGPSDAFSYGLALQFCQILPLAALGAVALLPYAVGAPRVQRQARTNNET